MAVAPNATPPPAEAAPEPTPVVEPTPAPAPVVEPVTPPPSADEPSPAASFVDLLEDDDLDADAVEEPGQETPSAEEPPAETPPEAAPEPMPEPAAEVPPVEVPPPAPEQAAPEPSPAEPVTPPTPTEEPPAIPMDEVRANYAQARTEMEGIVASQHYALDEAAMEAFDTNPAEEIPKIMARVYMDAVTGAVAHMMTHMPALVDSVVQGRATYDQAEEEFFAAWPQIDRSAHAASIAQMGQVYRQVNPNATKADFIRDVGAQVVVAFGLGQLAAVAPTPEENATPPAAPFKPAGQGGLGGAAPNKTNPFDDFTKEMESEELDLD